MKKIIILLAVALLCVSGTVSAQTISVSGQLGWAIPQGSAFNPVAGEKVAKGGLAYSVDALYFLPQFDNKLGVGVAYQGDLLFGVSSESIGAYSLNLYGVKGYYRFFNKKVTPYVALSMGLSQYGTPDITFGDGTVVKGVKASSFGVSPEIGVELGGFIISANYIVPMKYNFEGVKPSAGSLAISIGYRHYISF